MGSPGSFWRVRAGFTGCCCCIPGARAEARDILTKRPERAPDRTALVAITVLRTTDVIVVLVPVRQCDERPSRPTNQKRVELRALDLN